MSIIDDRADKCMGKGFLFFFAYLFMSKKPLPQYIKVGFRKILYLQTNFIDLTKKKTNRAQRGARKRQEKSFEFLNMY